MTSVYSNLQPSSPPPPPPLEREQCFLASSVVHFSVVDFSFVSLFDRASYKRSTTRVVNYVSIPPNVNMFLLMRMRIEKRIKKVKKVIPQRCESFESLSQHFLFTIAPMRMRICKTCITNPYHKHGKRVNYKGTSCHFWGARRGWWMVPM